MVRFIVIWMHASSVVTVCCVVIIPPDIDVFPVHAMDRLTRQSVPDEDKRAVTWEDDGCIWRSVRSLTLIKNTKNLHIKTTLKIKTTSLLQPKFKSTSVPTQPRFKDQF